MIPFTYSCPKTVEEALRAHGTATNVSFIGGGTNLIDLMKMGVEKPTHLVDVSKLPLKKIQEHNGGVRIGALVSNTEAANDRLIRTRYPVLSEAILAGATQQLRNKATMGGNLLQRTRCYYFCDPSYRECNKRVPGSGCAALDGYNRIHAILGASDQCIATNPSDMSVALMALDAVVQVKGPAGERAIPIGDFHRLPGNTPQSDTNLHAGELITAIDLPSIPYARRSSYIKVRDRNSYAFALVSIATVLDAESDGTIRKAHIALGGVALKPWRATKAEALLVGKRADENTLRAAAEAELQDAKGYRNNAFKIELAKRCIIRGVKQTLNAA
jgi:xanthine dehydrogenase YagS FAD-binding subunit